MTDTSLGNAANDFNAAIAKYRSTHFRAGDHLRVWHAIGARPHLGLGGRIGPVLQAMGQFPSRR